MKEPLLPGLLSYLLFLTVAGHAQETPTFEKIRDVSPDKKFAMLITCDSEPDDAEKIDSNIITGITLIALPEKKVIAQLLPSDDVGSNFENVTLVWSPDSKWCAFYYNQPRIGYTTVYKQRGDKFVELNKPGQLQVGVKGDVRNEFIKPLRWLKPATLLLEQYDIFRGGNGDDATFQFTVRFEKDGKFQVISKKKVPNKDE